MENLPEVIDLLANITKDFDYPLAMLTQELDILWFNDKGKEFFRRKKKFSTKLCDYAVGMKKEEAIKIIRSGTSCEYPAKNRVGKKIYLFETGYAERHLMLAAWVDEDEQVQIEHERTRIERAVIQHFSKLSLQRIFNATDHIESSTALDHDDELLKSLYSIERETYRMYLLLNDLQFIHKSTDQFSIESTKKFNFTEHLEALINATTVTLTALGVNLKFSNNVQGARYINSHPTSFSMSFLRLLKSIVMLMPERPRNVRVTLSEDENGVLLLSIAAKKTNLLNFTSDEQTKSTYSERGQNLANHAYAFEYRMAEMIMNRVNISLETELVDGVTTATMKTQGTSDPSGALKAPEEFYFGNDYSKINLIFGDVV